MSDSIAKMTKTKNADSRAEVLRAMGSFDGGQSDVKLVVPGHRTKRHITLEEYKAMLKSGMTPQQVIATTSKHLIFFYNAILDGRITLDRNEFVRMYESGVSLDEIAAKHGIPRGHVTFLREFYGIKRKGATFQRRLHSEVPLSPQAKSVIVGSILGDGHIHPNGYWSEKHCIAQADYLRWKASFVPDITTEKSFVEYESYDKRYGKSNKGLSFRTRVHSWLQEMGQLFYRGEGRTRTKVVPDNISDLLDETALAVWFMDDGNTDWGYRGGVKKHSGTEPRCLIHTEGFDEIGVESLCSVLRRKFGLSCKPCLKDAKVPDKWVVRLTSMSSRKLTTMLMEKFSFMTTMQYKINESAFVNR